MKLKRLVAVGLIASTLTTTSNAALDSVLTGMYINASSPDYTTSQFRGTLSGGSIYLRTPISNMQLFSIDPPRFSAGCGGIDMYLGSFSFITSAKLTQFFRSVAQNAAPLLFQMAVAQLFPQLDAAVKKFQQIAQDMNSQQMNSCKMAKGFVNAMEKNPAAAMTDLQTGITNTWSKVKGWAGDFAEAADLAVTQPSDATTRANASFLPDGRKEINELGNITWNALKARTWNGELLNLADNETNAMQMVMSMVGTEVRKSGASASADSVSPPFDPILRLTQLVAPDADSSGTVAIPIWSCGADTTKCENPTKASIASYGIKGFVSLNMLGAHDATAPQIGSIVYNITNCTTSGCGLSTTQLRFLNSIAKVPAVALLMNAQRNPNILGAIVPRLMEEMVDEVAVVYAGTVISVVSTIYSETATPRPGTYAAAMTGMLSDLRFLQEKTSNGIEKLNADMLYIDAANRSLGNGLNWRAKGK